MILTKEQVLKLKDMLLSDPDLSALAEEIDKVTDNRDIEIGKIIEHKRCEHKWSPLTKERIRKLGWADCYETMSEEELTEFLMDMTSYCEKCGLQYRFRNVNMDDVRKRYEDTYGYNIKISPSIYYNNVIHEIDREYHEELQRGIKRLENKKKILKKDIKATQKDDI